MLNNEKTLTLKFVECKCDAPATKFSKVKSMYGKTYIQIKCFGCGCSSPLSEKAARAVKEWNNHFGKNAKKIDATWTMDGDWERFI